MKKKESQKAQILRHLQIGRKITTLTAFSKFGCLRLGAVIYKLRRKEGYDIQDEMFKTRNKKRVKRYWMIKDKDNGKDSQRKSD